MLRSEITAASHRVLASLDVSGIPDLFNRAMGGPSERADPDVIFATFQKFLHEAAKFSSHELALLNIFGLKDLMDPRWWARLTKGEREGHEAAWPVIRGVGFLRDYLPKLVKLLERDFEPPALAATDGIMDFQCLLVVLAEEERAFSSPQRIIKALDSIQTLYEACARIHKENENGLSVISMDSGSDKAFDFLGAAKVVEEIRKIILDLWDRVVFFRERKFEQRLELITGTLPVLDRIDELSKNGSVAREECEIMKRKIIDGVSSFLETGAMLPEFADKAIHNPKSLFTPQAKLLTVIAPEGADQGTARQQPSLDEIRRIEDILRDMPPEEREAWLKGLNDKPSGGSNQSD